MRALWKGGQMQPTKEPSSDYDPTGIWSQTPNLQNCEKQTSIVCKPPRLWYSVTAAKLVMTRSCPYPWYFPAAGQWLFSAFHLQSKSSLSTLFCHPKVDQTYCRRLLLFSQRCLCSNVSPSFFWDQGTIASTPHFANGQGSPKPSSGYSQNCRGWF